MQNVKNNLTIKQIYETTLMKEVGEKMEWIGFAELKAKETV